MPTPQQQHANATTKAHQCYINSLPTLQQQHAGATVTACWHHSTLVLQGQHANATATAHRHLSNAMLKPQQRQANATAQRYSSDSLPTLQRQHAGATVTACRHHSHSNMTLQGQHVDASGTALRQHVDSSAIACWCYSDRTSHWSLSNSRLMWQHAVNLSNSMRTSQQQHTDATCQSYTDSMPKLQQQYSNVTGCHVDARHYSDSMPDTTAKARQHYSNSMPTRVLHAFCSNATARRCYSYSMLQLQHADATVTAC